MARGRRSGRRGAVEWGGGPFSEAAIGTTQSILASFTDVDPSTILRVRGQYLIKGTPDAATDDDVIALGLGIVSDAAAGVGGASVPGPINAPEFPWMWHNYVALSAGSAGLLGDDIGSIYRGEIDTKAMRKLTPGETLVLVAELTTGTYASVTVNGGFRALVMHG